MKTSLFLISTLTFLLPTLTMGLVAIQWRVSNVPASGLTDITFPISISTSPHEFGYYFAQEFDFIGQKDGDYVGLQPRPNSGGKPVIHAVFSSFADGTTTTDANCAHGADSGPGVSCSVEFSAPYTDGFSLQVVNTKNTTWTGSCVDITTGTSVHVGTYTLPTGTQGIAKSQVGFVEYLPWNDGQQQHTCPSLPYTSVVFGVPTTSTPTAVGELSNSFEYGDCVGNVDFKNDRSSVGVKVEVGF